MLLFGESVTPDETAEEELPIDYSIPSPGSDK
jgi:hypothetical protein